MWQSIQRNWKTNLIALVAFAYSVPQVVLTIQAWSEGRPTNWKQAVVGLLLAVGMAAAKDSSNVPTQAEVNKSTIETPQVVTPVSSTIKWNNTK